MPATLKKYQALQRKKKSYCAGRATKADVKRAASVYVTAAVAKGQTKAEAQRKADRVMKTGCSMTANITGRKRKATTAKRKTTAKRRTATTTTKRRSTTTTRARARA